MGVYLGEVVLNGKGKSLSYSADQTMAYINLKTCLMFNLVTIWAYPLHSKAAGSWPIVSVWWVERENGLDTASPLA